MSHSYTLICCLLIILLTVGRLLLKHIFIMISCVDIKVITSSSIYFLGHLAKSGILPSKIQANVNYLIGQFHVLPHSRGCIQSMQPFTTKGNGNVDGEALERRWAYFRLHMSSFKQMSAENR